jgi:DNA (cytosine-5)-methyltransferase 1
MNQGKLISAIIDSLSVDATGEKKYMVTYGLFNTAEYGIPQYRQRVIIYGVRLDVGQAIPLPTPTNYPDPENPKEHLLPPVTVGDALRGLPLEPTAEIPNHIGRKHGQAVMDRYRNMAYGERDSKTRINKLDPNKPSFTIVVGSDKGGGKGHIHPTMPREVTPRESARIQTFPDFWEFTGTSRHPIRQVGNAVPPLFAGIIASNLLRYGFSETDAPNYVELVHRLGLTYLE